MTTNGSALLRYAMIISLQKLTQLTKSNTADTRIQKRDTETQQENLENTKKTTEINWD